MLKRFFGKESSAMPFTSMRRFSEEWYYFKEQYKASFEMPCPD
jgi:hypothetical protein